MNSSWLDFLRSQKATFLDEGNIQFTEGPKNLTPALYPIPQLTALKVVGKDALSFLQGQLTCDMTTLNAENSFFAAFCNAKGRTISTLLIFKENDDFFLVLPTVLRDKVQKKLQMYVMRSDVVIQAIDNEYCLTGLACSFEQLNDSSAPTSDFTRNHELIKLPNSRYLMLTTVEKSIERWCQWLEEGLQVQNSILWDYLDISAGIAWLDQNSSENHIPQMLNIDKFGGISFDKGCYTGQEVVARTHYLGKAKRSLVSAEAAVETNFEAGNVINQQGELVGKIIKRSDFEGKQKLLVVMQTVRGEIDNLQVI
ncbi:MAG: folate-binding protein [Methylococcales bacterium]|nr:folate-binding protein [Methylococcales bacterium]